MTENGQNETTMCALILKISRKLRDYYLSGLAEVKISCVTIFPLLYVCFLADFMGKIYSQADLRSCQHR